MTDLVSVIIPVYKVEKYIDRCISSIVEQTYKHLEIILIDDGSPDNCPQICDEWAKRDSRIKVVHKQNEGAGKARNTGIDIASGDYVCFFDSDDYVEADTIETCLSEAKKNNADMIIFGYDVVTSEGRTISSHVPCPPKQLFVGDEIKNKLLPISLQDAQHSVDNWEIPLSLWNKFISLELIRKVKWCIVSEREYFSEDNYSLTELYCYLKRVCVIDRVLYHYTVNVTSLSRAFRKDDFRQIKIFYREMILLSNKMELGNVLEQPIRSLTIGFIIGSMKQLVGSELSYQKRYQEIRKIVKDEFWKELLIRTDYSKLGTQKKLLYKTIEYRSTPLCFALVYLKNKMK